MTLFSGLCIFQVQFSFEYRSIGNALLSSPRLAPHPAAFKKQKTKKKNTACMELSCLEMREPALYSATVV